MNSDGKKETLRKRTSLFEKKKTPQEITFAEENSIGGQKNQINDSSNGKVSDSN